MKSRSFTLCHYCLEARIYDSEMTMCVPCMERQIEERRKYKRYVPKKGKIAANVHIVDYAPRNAYAELNSPRVYLTIEGKKVPLLTPHQAAYQEWSVNDEHAIRSSFR